MKNVSTNLILSLSCIFIISIISIVQAQTSFNVSNKTTGDTLFTIDENGKVGIGTTAPVAKLEVLSSDPDQNGSIRVATSDLSVYLRLYSGRASFPNPFIMWNEGSALRFGTSFGSEFARLTSEGNLGIGTTTPTEMLEVADTIYSSVGGFKFPDGTVQATAAGGSFWNQNGSDIYFNTGNTGIGTTSPSAPLTILPGSNDRSIFIDHDLSSAPANSYGISIDIDKDISGSTNMFGLDISVANNIGSGVTRGINCSVSGTATNPKFGIRGSVSGAGDQYGVFGAANGSGSQYGVYGIASSTDTTTNYGGYFQAEGETGRGVCGFASNSGSLTNYGGYFQANSENGRGVIGLAWNSGPHLNYGGYFRANGRDGIGVYAFTEGDYGYGLWGVASGVNGIGVRGYGNNIDFLAAGPGTNFGSTSSIRWKKNIIEIDNPLVKINQLRGVYFDWDEKNGGKHDLGCIAEEVGEVLPEIVVYEENGIDAIGMDYSKLTPLLIEAVKEQQKLITELKMEIEEIKNTINK